MHVCNFLRLILFLIYMGQLSLSASTYYDTLFYEDSWTTYDSNHSNPSSSGPDSNQNNIFSASSGAYKGLTILSGWCGIDNTNIASMVNTISGGLDIQNGSLVSRNSSDFGAMSTNISGGITISGTGSSGSFLDLSAGSMSTSITGGVNINDGGSLIMDTYGEQNTTTNTISGGLSMSDSYMSMSHQGGWTQILNNNINDGLTITNNSILFLDNNSIGGTTNNTITGGITIAGATISLNNTNSGATNNTISGNIEVAGNGNVYLENTGTGTLTNTISGNVNITAGAARFDNLIDGTMSNTITGSTTISGGAAHFENMNTGTMTNTLSAVTLNSGDLWLGGGDNTTNVTTMNWNGGTMNFVYGQDSSGQNSFGTTHFNTLNIGSAPITLFLCDGYTNGELTYNFSDNTTIFTADAVTGNPELINIQNNSSFVEVVSSTNGPYGISILGDTVSVTLRPVAMAARSNEIEAITSAASNVVTTVNAIAGISSRSDDTRGFLSKHQTRLQMSQSFKENNKNPYEALMTALAAPESGVKFTKIVKNYRIWAAPYATQVRNNSSDGYMAGYKEKYYGLLFGATQFNQDKNLNINAMMGFGASKTQMDRSVNNYTTGKNIVLGGGVEKILFDNLELTSSLTGTVFRKTQYREGNPLPTQSYLAKADYNVYGISSQNEAGYVVKISDGFSIRPDVGIQLNIAKHTKIQERDAGIYAQNYRPHVTRNGEVYTGIGFRQKWTEGDYEGKITLKYEVGQKSGNGKSKSTVFTNSAPDGVSMISKQPSTFTQYVQVYGSVLDIKNDIKISPGAMMTFQKGQKSITSTIKLEIRF